MRNPYPKFVWFFGIVEDTSSDPLRLGRVRVRAVGFHPSSANTTDLPYAPVLNGGAARISNGQMVLGFFMDGEEAQQPCVLGTITGAVTGSNFVDNLKRAGITLRGIVEDIAGAIGDAVEGIFPDESPASVDKEFWTLVAICSKESLRNDLQGCADVAQSIYNRAASGAYVSSTVSGIILAPNQYAPTKINTSRWHAIKDIKTAAAATGLSESYLMSVAQTLKNPTFQKNSASFIQGRTDFKGGKEPANASYANGSLVCRDPRGLSADANVRRKATSNKFGFEYFYNKNVVSPIPAFVTNYKL